ncbi:MAG: TonB-dependent receptor [Gammaproteobacteria bacterium]|nr:TonB-dependent receptor [Gammaproteobacteria bacterium]
MDYQGRRNLGTGPGVAQALDPVGKAESDRYNLEVTYHDPRLSEFWDVTLTTNYQDISNKLKLVLFPPGAFDGTYPDGMIANPSAYERHVRLNVSGFYSGFTNHLFRIGTGLHYGDQYRVEEIKNINPDRVLLDVTDTADVFTPEVRRGVVYGFLQDEWNFNNDWNLTAGLRLDNYSDFGTTINPRLALVHQINFDTTTKLLYGRAFRPPSFAELHNKNNPSTYGNKDLQPETINTYEWIVDYHPIARLNSRMGFFYYNMKNIIQFVKDPASTTRYTAQNLGERTGYGFEWETQWRWNNTAKVMLNYAFQKSHDETSNSNIGYAPQHQVYVRSDWNISNHWATTTQINWVVDRLRGAGDERSMINDYATVDFSLRYQTALKHWDFGLTSKNIFNTDAREPSPTPGYIPNDLPLSGRSVYLEIRHAL